MGVWTDSGERGTRLLAKGADVYVDRLATFFFLRVA